jgi:hypothetical protein
VSRPRHTRKELEDVLLQAEEKGWRVEGGGNKHFKMKCPCSDKHMQSVSTTPSNPNYLRNLMAQLKRATCWEA